MDSRLGAARNAWGWAGAMAVQIDVKKAIPAEPADAFEVVSDVVGWPDVVRSIKKVEIQMPGPARAGALLRVDRIMFGRNSIQDMAVATIEGPRRLRLFVDHPDLHYELDHQIDSV
jgi:hypothetical protein